MAAPSTRKSKTPTMAPTMASTGTPLVLMLDIGAAEVVSVGKHIDIVRVYHGTLSTIPRLHTLTPN